MLWSGEIFVRELSQQPERSRAVAARYPVSTACGGTRKIESLFGSAGQQPAKEKAETEDGLTIGTRIHNLLFNQAGHFLVYFLGILGFPLGFVQANRFFAIWALCHSHFVFELLMVTRDFEPAIRQGPGRRFLF